MPKKTQPPQSKPEPLGDDPEIEKRMLCLSKALEKLSGEDRALILEYYSKREARDLTAARMGLTLNALRIRLVRVRRKLESDIEQCLLDFSPAQPQTPRVTALIPVIEQIKRLEPALISHLKQHNDDLIKINPILFEHLFAEFLAAQGFDDVRLVGRNSKTSADIFAAKLVPADIPIKVFVEVKRWKNSIGIEVINQVLGAFLGERERFGWNAALVVTVGGFRDFDKWSREELALKGLYLKDRDDLLRYLDGYEEHASGLWLPNPRTDL